MTSPDFELPANAPKVHCFSECRFLMWTKHTWINKQLQFVFYKYEWECSDRGRIAAVNERENQCLNGITHSFTLSIDTYLQMKECACCEDLCNRHCQVSDRALTCQVNSSTISEDFTCPANYDFADFAECNTCHILVLATMLSITVFTFFEC